MWGYRVIELGNKSTHSLKIDLTKMDVLRSVESPIENNNVILKYALI